MLLSRLSMCVFVQLCGSLYVCVVREGKVSDKWLSFGPEELFTNSCFIFSAQEERCVYMCVYVLAWKRETEKERRIKKKNNRYLI